MKNDILGVSDVLAVSHKFSEERYPKENQAVQRYNYRKGFRDCADWLCDGAILVNATVVGDDEGSVQISSDDIRDVALELFDIGDRLEIIIRKKG